MIESLKSYRFLALLGILISCLSFFHFRVSNTLLLDKDYEAFIETPIRVFGETNVPKERTVLGLTVSEAFPVLSLRTDEERYPLLFSLRTSALFHLPHVILQKLFSPAVTHFIVLTVLYSYLFASFYFFCLTFFGKTSASMTLLLTAMSPAAFFIGPVFPSQILVTASLFLSFVIVEKYDDKRHALLLTFFFFSTMVKLNYAMIFLPLYVIHCLFRGKKFLKPLLMMSLTFSALLGFLYCFPSFEEEFFQRAIESKKDPGDLELAFGHFLSIVMNSNTNVSRFTDIFSTEMPNLWEYLSIPFLFVGLPLRTFWRDPRIQILCLLLSYFLITFFMTRTFPFYFVHLQSAVLGVIIVLVLSVRRIRSFYGKKLAFAMYAILLGLFALNTLHAFSMIHRSKYDSFINQKSRLEAVDYLLRTGTTDFISVTNGMEQGLFEFFSSGKLKPRYLTIDEGQPLYEIGKKIFTSEANGTIIIDVYDSQAEGLRRAAVQSSKRLTLLYQSQSDSRLKVFRFHHD